MRERGRYRLVARGDGRHVVAGADGERDEVAVFEVAVPAPVVVEGGVEGGLLLGRKYRGKEEEEETRNHACLVLVQYDMEIYPELNRLLICICSTYALRVRYGISENH